MWCMAMSFLAVFGIALPHGTPVLIFGVPKLGTVETAAIAAQYLGEEQAVAAQVFAVGITPPDFVLDFLKSFCLDNRRMAVFELSNSQDIYHYTDVSGFLSIITNQEFWLSHIQFMNDRREYIEGKEKCKKILVEMQNLYIGQEKKFLETVHTCLDDESSAGFFKRSSKDVFSLSFSKNRDSLDMWRGYGNSSGIAIGLDIEQCSNLPGFAMVRKEQYYDELKKYDNNPEQSIY